MNERLDPFATSPRRDAGADLVSEVSARGSVRDELVPLLGIAVLAAVLVAVVVSAIAS